MVGGRLTTYFFRNASSFARADHGDRDGSGNLPSVPSPLDVSAIARNLDA
jgi:hypothetical protein